MYKAVSCLRLILYRISIGVGLLDYSKYTAINLARMFFFYGIAKLCMKIDYPCAIFLCFIVIICIIIITIVIIILIITVLLLLLLLLFTLVFFQVIIAYTIKVVFFLK